MGGHLCAKGCHMEVGCVRLICLVFFYCYGCMLTEKYYGLHLTVKNYAIPFFKILKIRGGQKVVTGCNHLFSFVLYIQEAYN